VDPSSLSDTNRRHRGAAVASEQQQQDSWDVGNWNGETLIYSRTAKDDEQILNSDDSSRDLNGQSDLNTQQKSTPEFDPIEAARQIKSVIGIGQTSKSSISDQQQKSKPSGQMLNTKVTPSPPQPRIPQQPVIFTDHFDGGVNKIDVQFGNLDEPSSSSAFYSQSESIPSNKTSQRTTGQSAHISPSIRPTDQPVMNAQQQQQQQQQRILPNQIPSQPSMTIKPVVTPQYAVHQQQQQINPSNVILQSLFYHHHQQQQQPEVHRKLQNFSFSYSFFISASNIRYFIRSNLFITIDGFQFPIFLGSTTTNSTTLFSLSGPTFTLPTNGIKKCSNTIWFSINNYEKSTSCSPRNVSSHSSTTITSTTGLFSHIWYSTTNRWHNIFNTIRYRTFI
jgi:hypothetical protein